MIHLKCEALLSQNNKKCLFLNVVCLYIKWHFKINKLYSLILEPCFCLNILYHISLFTLSIRTDRPEKTLLNKIRPQGYKTFFMLNSTEHEICPANKSQITNNCKFFLAKHS